MWRLGYDQGSAYCIVGAGEVPDTFRLQDSLTPHGRSTFAFSTTYLVFVSVHEVFQGIFVPSPGNEIVLSALPTLF